MDHRCLYGHRVPAAFTFAIQSRSCPTCGAPTVTVTGYQAARKLTTEAGLDAVAAFGAVRVLEAEWILTPVTAEPVAAPSAGAALNGAPIAPVAAAAPEEDEVVVVDEPAPAPVVAAPPEPPAPPKGEDAPRTPPRPLSRPEPRIVAQPAAEVPRIEPAARAKEVPAAGGFDNAEEDFFKRT